MVNDQWPMASVLGLGGSTVRLTVSGVVHSLPTIPQVQRIPALTSASETTAKDGRGRGNQICAARGGCPARNLAETSTERARNIHLTRLELIS